VLLERDLLERIFCHSCRKLHHLGHTKPCSLEASIDLADGQDVFLPFKGFSYLNFQRAMKRYRNTGNSTEIVKYFSKLQTEEFGGSEVHAKEHIVKARVSKVVPPRLLIHSGLS
jgi:hypothetical protein